MDVGFAKKDAEYPLFFRGSAADAPIRPLAVSPSRGDISALRRSQNPEHEQPTPESCPCPVWCLHVIEGAAVPACEPDPVCWHPVPGSVIPAGVKYFGAAGDFSVGRLFLIGLAAVSFRLLTFEFFGHMVA